MCTKHITGRVTKGQAQLAKYTQYPELAPVLRLQVLLAITSRQDPAVVPTGPMLDPMLDPMLPPCGRSSEVSVTPRFSGAPAALPV